MLKIDENSGYKGVRKVKKCKWVMIYINTFIENYYIFVRAKRAKKAIGYKL